MPKPNRKVQTTLLQSQLGTGQYGGLTIFPAVPTPDLGSKVSGDPLQKEL